MVSGMEASQKFLNVSEAAAHLGVSAASLRKWSDRGLVCVYRTPGGQRRYSQDDLARFLVSMRKPAFSPAALAAPTGEIEMSILEVVDGRNTIDLENKADAAEFKERVAAAVEGLSETEPLVI